MRNTWFNISLGEIDLKVLVDGKLVMNQRCEVAFKKGLHLKVASIDAKYPKQGW